MMLNNLHAKIYDTKQLNQSQSQYFSQIKYNMHISVTN